MEKMNRALRRMRSSHYEVGFCQSVVLQTLLEDTDDTVPEECRTEEKILRRVVAADMQAGMSRSAVFKKHEVNLYTFCCALLDADDGLKEESVDAEKVARARHMRDVRIKAVREMMEPGWVNHAPTHLREEATKVRDLVVASMAELKNENAAYMAHQEKIEALNDKFFAPAVNPTAATTWARVSAFMRDELPDDEVEPHVAVCSIFFSNLGRTPSLFDPMQCTLIIGSIEDPDYAALAPEEQKDRARFLHDLVVSGKADNMLDDQIWEVIALEAAMTSFAMLLPWRNE